MKDIRSTAAMTAMVCFMLAASFEISRQREAQTGWVSDAELLDRRQSTSFDLDEYTSKANLAEQLPDGIYIAVDVNGASLVFAHDMEFAYEKSEDIDISNSIVPNRVPDARSKFVELFRVSGLSMVL